jgi:hypothetical protein
MAKTGERVKKEIIEKGSDASFQDVKGHKHNFVYLRVPNVS